MPDRDAIEFPLAAEFPAATRADWEKVALSALKGRSLESLVSKAHSGLAIEPLYARRPDAPPITRQRVGAPWEILQRVDHPDPAAANAQALEDLENGATGLTIVFRGSVGDYGFGVEPSALALARVLEGVYLDAALIEFDVGALHVEDVETLVDFLSVAGGGPSDAMLCVGFDGFSRVARDRRTSGDVPSITQAALSLHRRGFDKGLLVADARVVHAAGGSEAQELGFALAAAVDYLRALEREGVDLDAARRLVFFRLAADAEQFLTIAKLRALRKLWYRIEESCGLAPEPGFISVETAWRMMTRRDPHVNLLRTSVAAFSAAVGGADAISVLPYTAAIGLPDAAARRLARNTQLILLEESNLEKVSDAAAGSGGIEELTDRLCASSWAFFQTIMRAGDVMTALDAGIIQNAVAAARASREQAIATRRDALTGTSEFPNLFETSPRVLSSRPQDQAAANRLSPIRLSEPFEALRDASDAILARTGTRPRVFLATLGAPSDHTARATFARSLFEAGGIEAVEPILGHDRTAVLTEFRSSAAQFVCLCGSDARYAEEGADALQAFNMLGAKRVYVAGRPSDALAYVGAHFVYAGCDAIATLRAAHAMLAPAS